MSPFSVNYFKMANAHHSSNPIPNASDSDFDGGNGLSSHADGNDDNDEDLKSLFVLHFGSLQSLPDPGFMSGHGFLLQV